MALYRCGGGKKSELYTQAKNKVLNNNYSVPQIYDARSEILEGGYYVDYKECWVYMKIKILKAQSVTPPNISTRLDFYDMPIGYKYSDSSGNFLLGTQLLTEPYNGDAFIEAAGVSPGTTKFGMVWLLRPLQSYPTTTPWHVCLNVGEVYEIYGRYLLPSG